MLRITNKRTNKTEKRPRGSNGLAERSLSFEFHANRSINKEMAADLVSCVQDNKQTNKQNSKRTPRFKRARRKKLKFRISCRSEHLKIFFENFFEKKNFSKRQKRSKMLGNDAKIHMLVVSEWKKRWKVVKKENS